MSLSLSLLITVVHKLQKCVNNIRTSFIEMSTVTTMNVISGPERYIDQDDNPITEHQLDDSRYSVIGIKRDNNDDVIVVRARDSETDRILTFKATPTEELYRGITIDGPERPRDVDEDIRTVIKQSGYVLVDGNEQTSN